MDWYTAATILEKPASVTDLGNSTIAVFENLVQRHRGQCPKKQPCLLPDVTQAV